MATAPPHLITLASDVCKVANDFHVDARTMERVVQAAHQYVEETRGTVTIISGYRTAVEQRGLASAGRPAARDDLSTHRTCPSTGVDISLGFGTTRVQKAIWGRAVLFAGLRWGGGSCVDAGGIPSDWQHVDLGPRHGGATVTRPCPGT